MRVISLNVNGIRAAAKKGLISWLVEQQADYICLQEVRATKAQLSALLEPLSAYTPYCIQANKKGYSGVAILTPHTPKAVISDLGFKLAATEGRYIALEMPECIIASLYLPSGTSGEIRQQVKYEFMDQYWPILTQQVHSKKPMVIAGDWNIAHKQIDLKNWRNNQKNSGFLPQERAWLDELIHTLGWGDAFRLVNQEAEQYTWWSYRGRAWDNNSGWRIDYQFVNPLLQDKITKVNIYTAQRFSDHAPLIIDYAWP
jgi:exodeoxyribonuclease-3